MTAKTYSKHIATTKFSHIRPNLWKVLTSWTRRRLRHTGRSSERPHPGRSLEILVSEDPIVPGGDSHQYHHDWPPPPSFWNHDKIVIVESWQVSKKDCILTLAKSYSLQVQGKNMDVIGLGTKDICWQLRHCQNKSPLSFLNLTVVVAITAVVVVVAVEICVVVATKTNRQRCCRVYYCRSWLSMQCQSLTHRGVNDDGMA